MKQTTTTLIGLLLVIAACGNATYAAPFDQPDDFEDGTTMNWTGGVTSLPQNIADGGPDGTDDSYLQIQTSAFHLGTYNATQWTGNFVAAGLRAIEMDMRHISSETQGVQMRILIFGPSGTFASRDRTPLITTAGWSHYRFGLSTGDLVHVTGEPADLGSTLQGVTKLLIRHDRAEPTLPGSHPPHVTATLGIDNIRGVREQDVDWPQIRISDTVAVTNRPVYLTHAGDGSRRLFVVEQPGVIRIVKDRSVLPTPFLDIQTRVSGGTSGGDERGLLGLAFPPGGALKTHFYVYYYASAPERSVLSRFRVDTNDTDVADKDSEEIILTIAQPQGNHNGGQISFGPDGYLYVGTGDGGGAEDDDSGHAPIGNGQSTQTLLGKILRLDVESSPLTNSYAIPPDNPFIGTTNALDEIWATGLRNPYRFSFDRSAHDLYIGDVGQFAIEEIDFQPAASPGGENYGWRPYEGSQCTGIQGDSCDTNGLTFPVQEYGHSADRRAVVGGYVHRGAPVWSFLQGTYLYADYSTGEIWGLKKKGTNWHNSMLLCAGFAISGFGEDEQGNVYVCDIFNNRIHRLEETLADSDADGMPDAYEVFYGSSVNTASDAGVDTDGDTMSNLDELIAGTSPTNASSYFRMATMAPTSGSQVVLMWNSVSDRRYGVEHTTNLLESFSALATNLPATPPVNVFTGATDALPSVFYRIDVRSQ